MVTLALCDVCPFGSDGPGRGDGAWGVSWESGAGVEGGGGVFCSVYVLRKCYGNRGRACACVAALSGCSGRGVHRDPSGR